MVEIDCERALCQIDGVGYPMVGLGTYRLKGKVCAKAILQAAKCGYRMIDTATYYENFDGIAAALKSLDRHSFYITSKVWHDMAAPKNVRKDFEATLKKMRIDYLDAYLVHWPNSAIPIDLTLEAMEELRHAKKLRHIGLSNVTVNHMKKALKVGVPITWVQVEMHPFFYDKELVDFCKKHSIVVQAWRPLNLGKHHEDALLQKLGKKHGKTAAQVALRWIAQNGCLPLPGSKSEKHMKENIDIADFSLSKEEMTKLNKRAAAGTRVRMNSSHGFTDEFDFSYKQCWPTIS